MSLPPTAHDSSPSSLPEGFHAQRRRVVQILKDLNNSYSTSRSCKVTQDFASGEIPPGEVSDGHWNLTPEAIRMMGTSLEAQSHRLVADEVERRRLYDVNYSAAARIFFADTAEYNAYEAVCWAADRDQKTLNLLIKELKKKKASDENLMRAWVSGQTDAMKLRTRVDLFINDLTLSLIGYELYAVFPENPAAKEALVPKASRRVTMVEKYETLHAVFVEWCEELKKTRKRYRNKAFEKTAAQCNEVKSTVQRAVEYVESGKLEQTKGSE